jgi:predicted DNA-binding transcriptional regulator AlpA
MNDSKSTTPDPMQAAIESMATVMLTFLKTSQLLQQMPNKPDEQIEGLPIVLQVSHISKIMGLSKSATYEMFKLSDFPAINGVNERKIVYRDSFFKWLSSKEQKTKL